MPASCGLVPGFLKLFYEKCVCVNARINYKLYAYFTATNCPSLDHPTNGQVYVIQNGQLALFICNEGYSIVGKSISYCVGGKWSFPPPVCK